MDIASGSTVLLGVRGERGWVYPTSSCWPINQRFYAGICRDAVNDQLDAASRVSCSLTFKENVWIRVRVAEVVRHLSAKGHEVQVHDPLADVEEAISWITLLPELPSDFGASSAVSLIITTGRSISVRY